MYKLLVSFQVSQIPARATLATLKGDLVLSLSVLSNSTTHRITRLNAKDVDDGDVKQSLSGRGESRLFKAVDDDGIYHMIHMQLQNGKGTYYLINSPYDTIRHQLNTSLSEFPSGSFLHNLDKKKSLTRGTSELYNLEKHGKFSEEVWKNSLLHLMADVAPVKFSKAFPNLLNLIPKRQRMGLFITKTNIYWVERDHDLIYDLTNKFYSTGTETVKRLDSILNDKSLPKGKEKLLTHHHLPHYTEDKHWISPVLTVSEIQQLIDQVETYESLMGAGRMVMNAKATRKTSGRYQFIGIGTFGRAIIPHQLMESLKNRMNGQGALVMNGDGFTLLYTLSDVNAVYIRAKAKTSPSDTTTITVTEPATPQPEPKEEKPKENPSADVNNGHITCLTTEPFVGTEVAIDPYIMAALFGPNTLHQKPKGKTMNDQTNPNEIETTYEQGTAPFFPNPFPEQETVVKYDDDFDHVFKTPVISSTRNVYFKVSPLSLHRLVLIDLPSPYGNYIPWEDVTDHNVAERFAINDGEMIGFGAATFYRTGNNVYKTDTLIRLDAKTDILPRKAPIDNLNDALKVLSKEMPLIEMISLVTSHYSNQ